MKNEGQSEVSIMIDIFCKSFPAPFMLFLLYVQLFTFFPGVMLMKKLSFASFAWGLVTYLVLFNGSDTIFKKIAGIRKLFTMKIAIFLFCLRFVNCAIYILIAIGYNGIWFFQSDWFALLNTFIVGGINGFCTTAFFVLGPEKVESHEKEKVGFLSVLGLLSGIFIGSLCAIFFEKLN